MKGGFNMNNHARKKSNNDLKIYGFGRFLIKDGTKEKKSEDWTSDKALKMFKYFLLNREKEIYNEELVEVFWPEIDPDTGKKRLYNTIYLIRKNLGIKDIVINKTSCYKFNESYSCWLDWEHFLDIYNNKEEATIKDLKNALELYKGDLMPDLRYESWIEDTRTNLKEKYLDIVYILSEKLYNNNEYMEAKLYLKKGIDEKTYREEYYNLAMKILAKTGRIYEAISLFVEYRKLIKNDLGIEPGTDIIKTYNKIRQNDIIEKETVLEEKNKGAFRCDIDVFKKIYELEERQTNRSSNTFILMEIDFSDFDLDNKFVNICEEIGNLFRAGDVICCCNKKIHLILHDLSIEKTNFTLKRIFDYLKEKKINKKPTFDFKEISK